MSSYCDLKNEDRLKKNSSWIYKVLVSIDQFGNVLARGNPDNTISSRTGHFVHHCPNNNIKYWKTLEWIIDFTFRPIDGKNHCLGAYQSDSNEKFFDVKFFSKYLLFILTTAICLIIAPLLYLFVYVFPMLKNDYYLDGVKIDLSEIGTMRMD